MKRILPALLCLCLAGCFNAKIDPKIDTQIDTKIDAKAEIESLVKAEISAIKAEIKTEIKTDIKTSISNQMDTKLKVVVGDIQKKIAENIQAEFNTQNQGMFSGGGVYVTTVAIALIVAIFGTFIWLLKKIMQWKQIWHILSEIVENNTEGGRSIKKDFDKFVEVAGLKHIVDGNLESRGLKRKKKS